MWKKVVLNWYIDTIHSINVVSTVRGAIFMKFFKKMMLGKKAKKRLPAGSLEVSDSGRDQRMAQLPSLQSCEGTTGVAWKRTILMSLPTLFRTMV